MKRSEIVFGLIRIPLDAIAVATALLLSFRLRHLQVDLIPRVQLLEPPVGLPSTEVYIETFVIPGCVLFLLIAALIGLYGLKSVRSAWNEAGKILLASIVWLVAIMVWYFMIRKQLFYSRILLLHATFFTAFFVGIGRTAVLTLQRTCLQCGIGVRRVLSIGSKPLAREAAETLKNDYRYLYLGHVRTFRGLQKSLSDSPDLIVQTDPHPRSRGTAQLIDFCRSHHIGYGFLPPVLADVPHLLGVDHLGLLPLMRLRPTPLDGWGRVAKRLSDILGGGLILIVLSPLLLLIGLLILICNGWPILYLSKRVGGRGTETFSMLKFRTMVRDADRQKKNLLHFSHRSDGPLFKMKNDPRITGLGKILRRFDLDELPQLLNVIIGQMSLVGPRPHLPEEVERYSSIQRRVFAVAPGMTGLAQVSGRSDLSFSDEVKLDLRYIEEWSPFLDLWILWRTVRVVLERSD